MNYIDFGPINKSVKFASVCMEPYMHYYDFSNPNYDVRKDAKSSLQEIYYDFLTHYFANLADDKNYSVYIDPKITPEILPEIDWWHDGDLPKNIVNKTKASSIFDSIELANQNAESWFYNQSHSGGKAFRDAGNPKKWLHQPKSHEIHYQSYFGIPIIVIQNKNPKDWIIAPYINQYTMKNLCDYCINWTDNGGYHMRIHHIPGYVRLANKYENIFDGIKIYLDKFSKFLDWDQDFCKDLDTFMEKIMSNDPSMQKYIWDGIED